LWTKVALYTDGYSMLCPNADRYTAENALSNRKPGAESRNMRSKPEPEVVFAKILDLKRQNCTKMPLNGLWLSQLIVFGNGEDFRLIFDMIPNQNLKSFCMHDLGAVSSGASTQSVKCFGKHYL